MPTLNKLPISNFEDIVEAGYMLRVSPGDRTRVTKGNIYKIIDYDIDLRQVQYIRNNGESSWVSVAIYNWEPAEPILDIEGI